MAFFSFNNALLKSFPLPPFNNLFSASFQPPIEPKTTKTRTFTQKFPTLYHHRPTTNKNLDFAEF